MVLQKAIDLQQPDTQTCPGNGPAKFNKIEENSGGKKVLAMLEDVMKDSKDMENEAEESL